MKNEDVVKLFDSYADDLYRFAVSYVGSKHDAEDVVQDVFLKLLSKNLLFDRRFEKAYLLTITANKCKDLLKSKARKTSVDLESADTPYRKTRHTNGRSKRMNIISNT